MTIARFMTDDTKLKATTAMKRVLRSRRDWKSSDDALIRRWQVKWKAEGPVYQERVRAERAEAERQRRERAAVPARQHPSSLAWGLVADSSAARHAAAWALGSVAPGDAMRRSAVWDTVMRPSKDLLAAANTMPLMGLSRAALVANHALAGITASEAVRASMKTLNASGIGNALKEIDTMGRALQGFSAIHLPKLPKES